jgi:drug/metabolite transporter (DMT)-like permease
MKSKLHHPGWRIVFVVGFMAFSSSYVLRMMNVEEPQFWTVLKYVIGYTVVALGVTQVLLSTIISKGEKIMWSISLILLPPLALLLYVIVYKRIHGFYIHPSRM